MDLKNETDLFILYFDYQSFLVCIINFYQINNLVSEIQTIQRFLNFKLFYNNLHRCQFNKEQCFFPERVSHTGRKAESGRFGRI